MGPFRIPIFLNLTPPLLLLPEKHNLSECPQSTPGLVHVLRKGRSRVRGGNQTLVNPMGWKVVKNQAWDLESLQDQLREPLQLQTVGVSVRLSVSINHYSHDPPR